MAERRPRDPDRDPVGSAQEISEKTELVAFQRRRAHDEERPWPAPWLRAHAALSVGTGSWEQFSIAYSVGEDIDSLREILTDSIEDVAFGWSLAERAFGDAEWAKYEADQRRYPAWYHTRMTRVALAVAFDVEDAAFDRLVHAAGDLALADRLVDRLIATRRPDRPIAADLLFPSQYAKLDAVFDAAEDMRSSALRAYVKSWATGKRAMHWFRGDGAQNSGRWAFDAAGVAAALGIDDADVATMPFYPTDLATRQLRGTRPTEDRS